MVEFALRPRRLKFYRSYIVSEYDPLDIRCARQDAGLAAMLSYAEEFVPYYRQVFANAGIRAQDVQAVRDLFSLPVLTRSLIRDNPDAFVPRAGEGKAYIQGRTGGSTGQPLRYRMSVDDYEAGVALMYRAFGQVGYRPGDSMVIVAGGSLTSISPGITDRVRDVVTNRRTLSSYGMSQERMAQYLDLISRWRPKFVRGYASSLLALSRIALSRGIPPFTSIRAVFSTAECLTPSARHMIEQVFGCEVIDGYGLNDGGVSATECAKHSGFHVDMERAVLEVVDETGRPVVGRPGRILATSLLNRAMPFVRYDTGDIGVMTSETCSCGRTSPLLSAILGRQTDLLVLDGVTIGSPVLTVLMGTTSAAWYQIVQVDGSSVVFRIVNPDVAARLEDEATIVTSMRRHVGEHVRVTFEYLDMPDDLMAGDKHRIVINRWQPQGDPATDAGTP
jgi:phenylacetate-CoA ligase